MLRKYRNEIKKRKIFITKMLSLQAEYWKLTISTKETHQQQRKKQKVKHDKKVPLEMTDACTCVSFFCRCFKAFRNLFHPHVSIVITFSVLPCSLILSRTHTHIKRLVCSNSEEPFVWNEQIVRRTWTRGRQYLCKAAATAYKSRWYTVVYTKLLGKCSFSVYYISVEICKPNETDRFQFEYFFLFKEII